MIRYYVMAFVAGQAIAVAFLYADLVHGPRPDDPARRAGRLAAMAELAKHCEPYNWPYIPQECQWREPDGDPPWRRNVRLAEGR